MKRIPLEEKYETLLIRRDGRKLTITMNRPDFLNAADVMLHEELADVFLEVGADPDSDVIVVTGAGRAFSAGGDIPWMQDAIENPPIFEKTIWEAKRIIYSMLDCEKPIIAKVNGHAVGLGATLALFCDVIFASEKAKIGDPHVSIGFVAADGGAAIWPQLIGFARAKEYLMTGDLLTANEAAQIGLINHAVAPDDLDARVDAFCDRLLNGATKAIRWTKATVNVELKRIAHAVLEAGVPYEALSNTTKDHKEAVAAFREKRAPRFTGE
jgi:enoyl-CoA hydratase